MKLIVIFLFLFLASGCATSSNTASSNAVSRYISQYEQSMKSGQLEKSIYYTGLYNAFSETNFVDKGISMKLLVSLISISKQLEAKEITADQYNSERMKYVADFEVERAKLFASIPQYQPQPYVYVPPKWPESNRIRCTTNSIGNTTYTDCN